MRGLPPRAYNEADEPMPSIRGCFTGADGLHFGRGNTLAAGAGGTSLAGGLQWKIIHSFPSVLLLPYGTYIYTPLNQYIDHAIDPYTLERRNGASGWHPGTAR